jgi:sigma-B regulation protein RsbU (phosphoserine phosphatase)
MALGVSMGNRLKSVKFSLGEGDYLIMYTDGVTEAFSPSGDIYGEGRLEQMIETTARCAASGDDSPPLSAQELLETIDRSVAIFMGDSMPSDDLTLLVLKRLHTES